jgi:hypothetical protein
MRIKINGKTISLFSGATAADAVRKYFLAAGREADIRRIPPIRDRFGHDVAPDGEISEGDELSIGIKAPAKKKKP